MKNGWSMQQRILRANGRRDTLAKMADVYLRAAIRVADGEDIGRLTHETTCTAITLEGGDLIDTAFAPFMWWFGQPRDYWFGRNSVYTPLASMRPDKYEERIAEVLANQQARIYALLFMRAMALNGDIEGV